MDALVYAITVSNYVELLTWIEPEGNSKDHVEALKHRRQSL